MGNIFQYFFIYFTHLSIPLKPVSRHSVHFRFQHGVLLLSLFKHQFYFYSYIYLTHLSLQPLDCLSSTVLATVCTFFTFTFYSVHFHILNTNLTFGALTSPSPSSQWIASPSTVLATVFTFFTFTFYFVHFHILNATLTFRELTSPSLSSQWIASPSTVLATVRRRAIASLLQGLKNSCFLGKRTMS